MAERDRQHSSLRTYEGDLHTMEKKENTLSNQIRDKDMMEERIVVMTNEINALSAKSKVSNLFPVIEDMSRVDRGDVARNWMPSWQRRKRLSSAWNRNTNRHRPS